VIPATRSGRCARGFRSIASSLLKMKEARSTPMSVNRGFAGSRYADVRAVGRLLWNRRVETLHEKNVSV